MCSDEKIVITPPVAWAFVNLFMYGKQRFVSFLGQSRSPDRMGCGGLCGLIGIARCACTGTGKESDSQPRADRVRRVWDGSRIPVRSATAPLSLGVIISSGGCHSSGFSIFDGSAVARLAFTLRRCRSLSESRRIPVTTQ